MSYREPGVYLRVENALRGLNAGDVSMIPLIVGSGAQKFKAIVPMTRGDEGVVDEFPYSSVVSISYIGYSPSASGDSEWDLTSDYLFVTETNEIEWVVEPGGEGPDIVHGPAAGALYYVELVYEAESNQYEPQFLTTIQDVIDFYGPDVQEEEVGTPVCPISLGAKIALEQGAPGIWALQVNKSGDNVTASEYQLALENHAKFIDGIWRIIPMDMGVGINSAVYSFITAMSTPEEGKPGTSVLGKLYTLEDPAPTTFSGDDGVLAKVGGYAESIASNRLSLIYPDVASKVLSTGDVVDLGAPFLAAAFAGAEMLLKASQSRTKMSLLGFEELKGVRMTRPQKNLLAAKGVLVLEQLSLSGNVTVRHGINTNMSTIQMREISITAITDYCSIFLKSPCQTYVGKYNITPEVINMVRGSIISSIKTLTDEEIIVAGRINFIMQDEDNPDTIVVSVSIFVPYSLNYIDIVLIIE